MFGVMPQDVVDGFHNNSATARRESGSKHSEVVVGYRSPVGVLKQGPAAKICCWYSRGMLGCVLQSGCEPGE